MTATDFGTITVSVLARMDYAESELTGDERRDTYKALQTYKAAVIEAIREAFDEEEIPAAVQPTCPTCGSVVEKEHRFCSACRMPLTPEAAAASLERLFAKELGRDPYDPCFRASLARVREEAPDQWDTLVQKLTVPAKA